MILGITGAFGCGKSSVLSFFASHNWHVFDADFVCRSFYDRHDPLIMDAVLEIFGKKVLLPNGDVDKKQLAAQAFVEPEKMQKLTAVMYPLLTTRLETEINYCREQQINGAFELPLLYEAGFEYNFNKILAVWTSADIRRKRLYGRNFSDDEIDRRNRMQLDADAKLEKADFAVINNGSIQHLTTQLDKLLSIF
jgi:dephospho-CoA kinase